MDILAETIKGFKGLTLEPTINDSAYYHSDKNDTERDPLVATHTSDRKKRKVTDNDTTNRKSPQKSLINRTLPMAIPLIDPRIPDGVAAGRWTTHAHQTPASKVTATDMARSGTRVFRTPGDLNQTDKDWKTPRYGNTSIRSPRFNSPVLIGGGTNISPTRTGIQDIISSKGPTGPVEVRNAQILHTSVNGYLTKNRDPTPTLSKLIGL